MHFGWLIRSAHAWSANLMIFAILVHMFSVFFMKAYRKPREFGWLSGMALLGLASVFGFSGYLLPMDELSYFATKVGLQIPAAIPLIGPAVCGWCNAMATPYHHQKKPSLSWSGGAFLSCLTSCARTWPCG
jgi:quinol-cytochrome oxidoreductase complex cytochrome b subunit